jgi:hypothetical protein
VIKELHGGSQSKIEIEMRVINRITGIYTPFQVSGTGFMPDCLRQINRPGRAPLILNIRDGTFLKFKSHE